MRRSSIGVVAGVAAIALAVTACSSSGNGNGNGNSGSPAGSGGGGGNVTLNLVAADYGTGPANASQKYWQGIADDFHATNPNITVKVTTINWNDFDNQVQTMVQNKQYPDITEGDYFSDYAQQGLLYTADEVLSDPSNLLPSMKDQGSLDGKQYGMPFTTSARTLFYNKKLFASAGIADAPKTWDDIKTDAEKLKAKGVIGFGMPLGSEEAQAEALLWFLGNGGNFKDSGGNWAIDSDQNVETLNFMKDLVKAGDTEPNPATKNRTDLWKEFADGKIGMINGSPALIPIIQDAKVLQDGDWTSVPIAGKNGPLDSTLGVCDNVAAFKQNGHQAQIKAFLDFAYQDKYQLQFDKEYDLLPATTSGVKALSSDPTFGPFLTALPKAVGYPTSDPAWSPVKTEIQHTLGTAMTGDPKSVLSAIQQVAKKNS